MRGRAARRISILLAVSLVALGAVAGGVALAETTPRDPGGPIRQPSDPPGDTLPDNPERGPGGGLGGGSGPAPPPVVTVPPTTAPSNGTGGSSGSGTTTSGGGLGGGGTGAPPLIPGVVDLTLTKTDSPDPVLAGANLTYTITVTNDGELAAPNATVLDQLPNQTAPVSSSASQGSCSHGGGGETCSLGTIAGGGTATVTFVVQVLPNVPAGTILSNTAVATTTATEASTNNNDDTATTTVATLADVAVTKSNLPNPVPTGTNLTYSIPVANLGPSDAQNVSLTDALPAGTTFVSLTAPAGWTATTPPVGGTGTVTATKATLAGNDAGFFTLVVHVTLPSGNLINNTATVTSTTTDPNATNNTATSQASVSGSADVSVTKTDNPDPVTAGNNLTYTVTAANAGGDFANNVTLADTLPANTTFVSLTSPAGWSCTTPSVGATGAVSCSNPSVAPAASGVFTLVVKVNSSAAGGSTISNTASVSSSTFDPNTSNNSATATTAVNASADLSVTKTASPLPVTAGTNLTYSLGVSNAGPSNAQSVSFTDAVPAGTTFVSFTQNTGPAFTLTTPAVGGTGTVTASNASFAPGAPATFTMVVKVNANAAANSVINNSAHASSTTTDPNPISNSDAAAASVITSADLAVTKTDSPDPVTAGNNLTYSINLSNGGPSDAQSATLSDTLPTGTTFVSLVQNTGPAFSCTSPAVGAGGTVNCTIGSLPAGAVATFTVVVHVDASVASGATITNTATVSSPTTDPAPANNSATASTTVATSADLSVSKTDSPDPVIAGNNVSYLITVTNGGPSNALGVSLSDVVPTGTSFVSATPSQGTCAGTTTVTCTLGTIPAGGSATITLAVKVDPAVANGSTITNTATATTTTADPNSANNSATATTAVTTSADLAVTKSGSPDPVIAGTDLTYTLTATNNGPSNTGGDVTVTDTLPAGTSFVSATPSAGSCIAGPPVTCDVGPMATNATVTITVVVHVDSSVAEGSKLSNNASVSSATSDPDTENNSVVEATRVETSADVALTKDAAPDPVTAGNDVTYTITAKNNGPSDAQDVTVTDPLPPRTTFASVTPSQGSCTGTSTVKCELGTLANWASATITLVVHVDPDTPGGTVITNTATESSPERAPEVKAATADPTKSNNSASASVTVLARPKPASASAATVAVAVVSVPNFTG